MKQETKSVSILALRFGLVGIDRYLITPLFPIIAHDLHLGYGDIGTIAGALAIAWSIAALLMGNLSDRIGRRRVLVGALILFGLLIGASGLATGLMGLVAVRLVMGFADGAFTPASISATIEASPPERHGRNIGLQQMTLTLFRARTCAPCGRRSAARHQLAADLLGVRDSGVHPGVDDVARPARQGADGE